MNRFVCLILLATLPTVKAAAESFDVQMPDKSALPKERSKDKKPKEVWVASEGYQPRSRPERSAPPSGAPAAKFCEFYRCVSDWQAAAKDGGEFLLLAQGNSEDRNFRHIGWVEKKFCILGNEAEQTGLKIARKALLVNTPESTTEAMELKKQGKAFIDVPVRLSAEPGKENEGVSRVLKLFNVHFIYGDTKPGDKSSGHLLIGTSPNFNYGKSREEQNGLIYMRDVILGWVPKSRVCEWDTREAMEWNWRNTLPNETERRGLPGVVYRSMEDADRAIDGEKAEPILQEVFDQTTRISTYQQVKTDKMRFPVLDFRDANGRQVTPPTNTKAGRLHCVGFVGGYVDEKGEVIANADQVEDYQRKLQDLEREIEQTEILFVIDSTASMEKYVAGAADTIDRIVRAVRADKSRKVRIGLSLYTDTDAKTKPRLENTVIVRPLVDATDAAAEKFITDLRKMAKDGLDSGGDPREQMFYGIRRGIDECGFTPFARRIVVVIADMADHDMNKDGQDTEERKIVERLVEYKPNPKNPNQPLLAASPIDFFAIHVKNPEGGDEDVIGFKRQIDTIIKRYDEKLDILKLKDPKRRGYVYSEDTIQITDLIMSRYEKMRQQLDELKRGVAAAQRGEFDSGLTTAVPEELIRTYEARQIDVMKFAKANGMQLFQRGYVWDKSVQKGRATKQVRLVYLVNKNELDNLNSALETLRSEDDEQRPNKDKLCRMLLDTTTGESPKKDDERARPTFQTLRLKSKGLTARSQLLNRCLEDVDDNKDTLQELYDIRLKLMRLEDIAKNQRSVFKADRIKLSGDEYVTRYRRDGKSTPALRDFRLFSDKSSTWYWLDYDEEWP